MHILIKAFELRINNEFYISDSVKNYKVLYNNRRKIQICEIGKENDEDTHMWIEGHTEVNLKVGGNAKMNLLSDKLVEVLYQKGLLDDVLTAMEDYSDIKSKVDNPTKIYKETLASALYIAIEKRQVEENNMGYDNDSAMVVNWKECYNALNNGKNISTK